MPPQTPLTQADLDAILKLMREGVTVAKIAERYGRTTTTIYQIRDGEHSLQVKVSTKARQLVQVEPCPGCGRPLVSPCQVCGMRKAVARAGGFDISKWNPPGAR